MDRTSNLVSVVIPCYNHGKLIQGAIDSILKQTYTNFEIIIVDDGSTEKRTTSILRDIKFPKTRVYRKENGGPASARNYGIRKSSGEYILTLDADDKFHPAFVEKAVYIMQHSPETGMVTSYVKKICKKSIEKAKLQGGDISSFLIKHNASASLLYRYECWEDANGYDENIPGFEDWDFAIGVTKNGWKVYSIPEYLFFYRKVGNSQYQKDLQKSPQIIKYITEKHASVFREHITEILYAKELQIQEYSNSIDTYKNSYAQKIGNAVIKPMKVLQSLLIT